MPKDYIYAVKDGRNVGLDEVFQSKTYAGLLEGAPNERVNRDILSAQSARAAKIWPDQPCVVLGLDLYLARLAQALPPVRCAGLFISYRPARNTERMASSLVIVWFQEDMFEPPLEQMAEWMMSVAWNEVARDFDW
jgi:hypothetical protein